MGFEKLVFGKKDVMEIINEYGSPVYVYDEEILRKRCQEMKNLLKYPRFRVNYSAKANTNVELLKIVCSEGLDVDGMSRRDVSGNEGRFYSRSDYLYRQ